MTIDDIAHIIKNHDVKSEPILIAIEGYGGSGKSTYAQTLKGLLGDVYIVPIDDFIVKEKLSEQSWDKGAFDRKRLEIEVLEPLSRAIYPSYRKLVWDTNSLSEPIKISKSKYVIIEGISSYHPSVAHYYAHKIWIDTPIEIAKERGRARDGSNENAKFWDLWANNDLAYQEHYHPERVADFILTNT